MKFSQTESVNRHQMGISMVLRRIVTVLVILIGNSLSAYALPVNFCSSRFNLPIPKNPNATRGWMTDATIEVSEHHIITDLDIGINLTHTSVFDLQIFLQSPAGTKVSLNTYDAFEDEFFIGADYTQTVFDDEAAIAIEQAQPPFTGRFRPKAPFTLSSFDGEDVYGLWQLQIYDAFDADTGTFDSFELMINNPEPATAMLLALGAGILVFFRRR